MNRSVAVAAGLVIVGGLLAACSGPSALLLEGDADSAKIAYGGDLTQANAVAARHCARYERVPQFRMADMDTAYYACVKP